jgi:membrane-bound lytic murein transglycosylase D
MSFKLTLWLPALAMAASTLPTHLHTSQDGHVIPKLLEKAPHEMVVPFHREPKNKHLKPVEEKAPVATNPPEEQTLDARDDVHDIWERLRAGFNLPQVVGSIVHKHIEYFSNHPRHIERILQRGEPFLHYILSRLEERGLPTELALLPFIESAFDPFSRSPAGAAGIWQFMPVTAKHVGLRRDWWFDGRLDIVAATEAALDYLSELHQRFDGDWLMALGAYNAGATRINKAIRLNHSRGKPEAFWHLPLPDETRNYVPKLLALRAIISNPEIHHVTLPVIPNTQYFTAVDIAGPLDLQVVAQLTGATLAELQRLNPGLIRSITPPAGTHRLLIPSTSEQHFREQLARIPTDQRVKSVKYRVRKGDTLSVIAQNNRTTVTSLRQMNQLESTRIFAGMFLIIPLSKHDDDASDYMQTS